MRSDFSLKKYKSVQIIFCFVFFSLFFFYPYFFFFFSFFSCHPILFSRGVAWSGGPDTQVADGTREFTPTPTETRDVVSKMYRARRTILVRFENDSIDESEEMKGIIQEGKTLLRMKVCLVLPCLGLS